MTITVWASLIILFGHWLFDFVFQPDWMGKGKSKSWSILLLHAEWITFGAFLAAAAIELIKHGLGSYSVSHMVFFALINGVAHFGIDAVTSRMTGKAYAKGDHHKFFTIIGFDQFLHIALALITLWWLL